MRGLPITSMHIALIIPTLGRPDELNRLLDSLANQTFRDFEAVVVDQGQDLRVQRVVEDHQATLQVSYTPSPFKGASRARNEGIKYAQGDVIAWPDDDCTYPPDLLETVAQIFQDRQEVDGICGILVDEAGKPHHWASGSRSFELSGGDLFFKGSETVVFVRARVVERIGGFDEVIGTGAGSPWGAGEATDFGIRSIQAGMRWWYCPEVRIHHPNRPVVENDPAQRRKAYHYAVGRGAVLRKHRFNAWFVLYYFYLYLRPVVWALVRGKVSRAFFHLLRLKGVIRGWWVYPRV